MNPIDIRAHLHKVPFRPIRIYVSDGSSYEVLHPELVVVSRTEVVIATELAKDDLPERLIDCDPLHITRIEPINGAKASRRGQSRN